jgi:hypothetical protein
VSDVYLYRFRRVQGEYDAVREAIALLYRNWNRRGFGDSLNGVSETMLEEATRNLERTYFIRLYAEFEGILKDHLVSNHPAQAFAEEDRPRVDDVIARVRQAENLTINPRLRDKLDAARDYRNSIAHSRRTPVPQVSFADGQAALGRLVGMLPDPRN